MRRRGRVGRTNDLVMLAEFDSTEQAGGLGDASWLSLVGPAGRDSEPLRVALGKLRLESVLSRQIVLTDAQALDGRIVLAMAASGLLEWLRPDPDLPLPLLLRTRRVDLHKTVAAMHDPAEGGTFRSSFLSNGREVAGRLTGSTAPGAAEVGPGGMGALLTAGAVPDEVAALEIAWQRMDALIADGSLPTTVWDTGRPWRHWFDLAESFDPLENRAVDLARDEADRRVLMELRHLETRSAFLEALDASGWDSLRTGTLREWFEQRYQRAIAFQHQADFRSIHGDYTRRLYDREIERRGAVSDDGQATDRVRRITLPEDTLARLGQLTPTQWQRRYGEVAEDLAQWWDDGEVAALEAAFTRLVPEGRTRRRTLSRYGTLLSFGLGPAAQLAALPQDPNPSGIALTVLLGVGVPVVQSQVLGRRRSRIAVTDYLDDVTPGLSREPRG